MTHEKKKLKKVENYRVMGLNYKGNLTTNTLKGSNQGNYRIMGHINTVQESLKIQCKNQPKYSETLSKNTQ